MIFSKKLKMFIVNIKMNFPAYSKYDNNIPIIILNLKLN